jgi:2,3-bisphosphoglycerate-dependent phosphoglycerate mutase
MPVEIVFETDALTEDKERGIATGWLPGRLRTRGRTNAAAMCDGAATTYTSREARESRPVV